jgi:hypothetical protein
MRSEGRVMSLNGHDHGDSTIDGTVRHQAHPERQTSSRPSLVAVVARWRHLGKDRRMSWTYRRGPKIGVEIYFWVGVAGRVDGDDFLVVAVAVEELGAGRP